MVPPTIDRSSAKQNRTGQAVLLAYFVSTHSSNWLKRVRSAAVVRFFERHVVELEKQLRMGDQHEFFQNIKSVQLEKTKKVES